MSATLPVLPNEWIKRIFERFGAVYGPARMHSIWGTDLQNIFAVWAEELSAFGSTPSAIKYALENLPEEYPPSLVAFKQLCREGVKMQANNQLLLANKPTQEDMQKGRENMEKIKAMISNIGRGDSGNF